MCANDRIGLAPPLAEITATSWVGAFLPRSENAESFAPADDEEGCDDKKPPRIAPGRRVASAQLLAEQDC
jgi:hypothetical protein